MAKLDYPDDMDTSDPNPNIRLVRSYLLVVSDLHTKLLLVKSLAGEVLTLKGCIYI